MHRRELLEEAKCHLTTAIIGAVVAAGSAYAAQRQAAAGRRNARNAAALNNLPGGGGAGGSFQPTALAAQAQGHTGQELNQMGIADMLKQGQPQFNELPQDKPAQPGFSQDAKPPVPGAASTVATNTAPGTKDPDSRMFAGADQAAEPKDNTNTYVNAATSLAGIAQGLAQRPQMQGAPIPQPGPMNFQPTALAMLARRNPYGGY